MANEQFAFLKSGSVPTRDQWQQAIDRAGFDLKLDPKFEPHANVGFVPCTLNGGDSGVEMYFDDSTEFIEEFAAIAGDRDCCISFRWGGSMQECACAMIASFALAAEFGAAVSYEGAPPYQNLADLRKDTEAILEDAAKDTQPTAKGRSRPPSWFPCFNVLAGGRRSLSLSFGGSALVKQFATACQPTRDNVLVVHCS
ncbi:MAG TPA: hypothetical protein VKS79_00820 [Gemmataceae bacterium]|nr:hypothetical protein [Gemmataceae bacterium]